MEATRTKRKASASVEQNPKKSITAKLDWTNIVRNKPCKGDCRDRNQANTWVSTSSLSWRLQENNHHYHGCCHFAS
eukprot:6468129-Amphidinium_carterae.1